MEGGVAPKVAKWPAYAGLALLACLLGAYELSASSHPPFTGRWAWLHAASYGLLGEHGVAYFWFGSGVVAFLLALRYRRIGASPNA